MPDPFDLNSHLYGNSDPVELPTFDGDDSYDYTPAPEPEPRQAPEPQPQPTPAAPRKKEKERDMPRRKRDPKARTPRIEVKKPAEEAKERIKRPRVRFADTRTAMFLGIVLVIAAAYILIASISYFSSASADQSLVTGETLDSIANDPSAVRNTTGPLGALLSHSLISQWMGIGAFIIIFYVAAIGLMLLKVWKLSFWRFSFKALMSTVAISVILGFVTMKFPSTIMWGGTHGYTVNRIVMDYASVFGAAALAVIMAALLALMFLPELKSLWITGTAFMHRRRSRILQHREQRAGSAAQSRPSPSTPPVHAEMKVQKQPVTSPKPLQEQQNEPHAEVPAVSTPIPSEENIPDHEETADVPELTIEKAEIEQAETVSTDCYDPTADLSRYRFPDIDCLVERLQKADNVDLEEQEENQERITKTLRDYGIEIANIKATVGPTVTLYEIVPAEGVRIAKIKRLEDDIALNLAALGIRIIAPIPGRGTIGIEVPNKEPQVVSMRSIITSADYQQSHMELPMAMGSTIDGKVFMADLCKMPHLLVAGATGMGKSVGLNAIICSLLYKKHPAELKFVLIDPKMVEFSLYSKLERHYLAKLADEEEAIITDPSKVITTLKSLCVEMDQRYELLKKAGLRNIKEYNGRFIERRLNPEKGHRYLPYIVVIVDEFADLIMTAGKEVETPIARIAQKARAVGIHMILATQRPSTNVITGIIKANFPGRVAFRVTQMVDSRTILDRPGANQLIGRGDMLFSRDGEISRVQCAFIDTPEVEAICEEIDNQIGYEHAYYLPECLPEESAMGTGGPVTDRDPLFEDCARLIVNSGNASTSSLQRAYSIGYNRAGKIMDQLEAAGVVGPSQGSKPRNVLMDPSSLEHYLTGM